MTEMSVFFIAVVAITMVGAAIWYFLEWLFTTSWWCDTFHRGGSIKPDHTGQINWQCDTCHRWHNKREL